MPDLLGGLAPEVWDGLARDHFYSSRAWLRTCAHAGGTVTAAAVEVGGALGAVPMALLPEPCPSTYDWNALLRARDLPPLPGARVLVGPSLGYQTHLLGNSAEPPLVRALVDRIGLVGSRLARGATASRVAMYLSTADVRALSAAGVPGPPVLIEPDAWFDVPEGGWRPWLASLRKGARYRVRDDRQRFDAAGHTLRRVGLSECLDRLPPLAVELARKLGFNDDRERFVAEFARYAECTGDAARVVLCERADGALVGFSIYYVWGDTVYLRWAALDYPRLDGKHAEYFTVAYYTLVDLAGEIGARRVHLGKKVLDAKVFRGARLRPLWLMDLTPGSPLVRHAAQVRRHNARVLGDLLADPRMVNAIGDRAEWEVEGGTA